MNINYNKQNITQKDINAVVKTLKSDRITQGKKLIEIEERLKNYFKCKYCVVLNSGTSAQFLLAKSLNFQDFLLYLPLKF